MALSMIERAEQRGALRPGMTVVEYTGGSTGISLAFVCAVKGYRCRIVSSDAVAKEKLLPKARGARDLLILRCAPIHKQIPHYARCARCARDDMPGALL